MEREEDGGTGRRKREREEGGREREEGGREREKEGSGMCTRVKATWGRR